MVDVYITHMGHWDPAPSQKEQSQIMLTKALDIKSKQHLLKQDYPYLWWCWSDLTIELEFTESVQEVLSYGCNPSALRRSRLRLCSPLKARWATTSVNDFLVSVSHIHWVRGKNLFLFSQLTEVMAAPAFPPSFSGMPFRPSGFRMRMLFKR